MLWSPSKAYVLKERRQGRAELLDIAVVAYNVFRSFRLFLLRELSRGARLHPHVAAIGRSLADRLLVRHHGDRVVEHAVHARLEQQRDLDDERPGSRVARA